MNHKCAQIVLLLVLFVHNILAHCAQIPILFIKVLAFKIVHQPTFLMESIAFLAHQNVQLVSIKAFVRVVFSGITGCMVKMVEYALMNAQSKDLFWMD